MRAKRLLAVADSLKARVMLSLSYGCGLRAGEVVRLKVKHIDSAQKIIRVEQSKGRKDRNVMLSPEMLDLLRQWWKVRPSRYDGETPVQERWLFPSRKGDSRQADNHPSAQPVIPRSDRSSRDQEERDTACAAPQLRHPSARARHRYQNHPGLLGHDKLETTARYTPRRHRHDRQRREPARSAVAAAQEGQKATTESPAKDERDDQHRTPAGVTPPQCPVRSWRSRISSATTGRRGVLPMPVTSASTS